MSRTFILVDSMNLAFRSRHMSQSKDVDLQIGMAMHIMLQSVASVVHQWSSHDPYVVFNFEGKSWRKAIYPPYKAQRRLAAAQKTEREKEDDALFIEAVESFRSFIDEKTNALALQHNELEADDLIALWIDEHPDDEHIIVSTDSDYKQLIAANVKLYDGVRSLLYTIDGVYNEKGNQAFDSKGKPMPAPEPEWELFFKCIRGDKSDNIFSAYPGAREKGTKNKVGIREAFEDRHDRGYAWNNFMLQRWTDHEEKEHKVREKYELNKTLIDLRAQPEEYRTKGQIAIYNAKQKPPVSGVGFAFAKFCGLWDLKRISQKADYFTKILNKHISKEEV